MRSLIHASTSPRKRLIAATGAAMLAVFLTACAQPTPSRPAPPPPAPPAPVAVSNTVEGSVAWRERIALPPNAELIVRLQDTSRADAPARVVSERRISLQNSQPPIRFSLPVEPSRIDPRARYTVSARVESNGQLIFINDTAHPVLTQGGASRVDMMLVHAGR